MIRGGTFLSRPDQATTTIRVGWPARGGGEYDNTGFRCAKDVPAASQPVETATATTTPSPLEPRELQIEILGERLSINGKDVPLPVETAKLFELLGRPNRISTLKNTIYSWDNLGVFAYQRPNSSQVIDLSIAVGMKQYDFWPSKEFSGILTIDGARLTAQSSCIDLNRIKSGRKFEQNSRSPFIWEIGYEDLSVSINRGTFDTYDNSGQIVHVSLGVRNGISQ